MGVELTRSAKRRWQLSTRITAIKRRSIYKDECLFSVRCNQDFCV